MKLKKLLAVWGLVSSPLMMATFSVTLPSIVGILLIFIGGSLACALVGACLFEQFLLILGIALTFFGPGQNMPLAL